MHCTLSQHAIGFSMKFHAQGSIDMLHAYYMMQSVLEADVVEFRDMKKMLNADRHIQRGQEV
jgi:hypothetical protein